MMTFRKDWDKAFIESPLVGNYKFYHDSSRVKAFKGNQLIFTASVKQEEDSEYNLWDKIELKKYPIVCPHCEAPHNPNEVRCEYCGGYMKEE